MADQHYISVPVDDIHVDLPLAMSENTVKLMFRSPEVIDTVIEQLQRLKEYMQREGLIIHVRK